jgi:hypothetical protein
LKRRTAPDDRAGAVIPRRNIPRSLKQHSLRSFNRRQCLLRKTASRTSHAVNTITPNRGHHGARGPLKVSAVLLRNSFEEIQHFGPQWLSTYRNDRSNISIGGITPAMKLKMAAYVLRSRPVENGRITRCQRHRSIADAIKSLGLSNTGPRP